MAAPTPSQHLGIHIWCCSGVDRPALANLAAPFPPSPLHRPHCSGSASVAQRCSCARPQAPPCVAVPARGRRAVDGGLAGERSRGGLGAERLQDRAGWPGSRRARAGRGGSELMGGWEGARPQPAPALAVQGAAPPHRALRASGPRSPCWSWFQGSRRASVSELGRAISRAPNSAPGSNSGTQRSGSPDLSQMFERPPLRICWRPWPPQGAVELDLFSRIQGMRVCSAGAGEAARLWLAAGSARRDLGVFQMLARDSAGRASGALRPTSVDGGWSLHTSRGRLSDVRG